MLSTRAVVITVSISSDPNDPEVQAISAFLRVLNALENIRSAIKVAARGRQMSNLADARDLAGLALSESQETIQVLSAEHSPRTLRWGTVGTETCGRGTDLAGFGAPAEGQYKRRVLAGRRCTEIEGGTVGAGGPATLPASFRNYRFSEASSSPHMSAPRRGKPRW